MIKGVGASSHIESLLQNGIVAREFLGSASDSDSTPLDTDLSMILERSESISQAIEKTAANSYGPVYFVVHHDQRFSTTRRSPGESDQSVDSRWRTDKLESFYTGHLGNGHYGIRTGFASGEIDFIVCDEQLGASVDRIKLEIAKNGFYIPIVARESEELIFTPEEFDQLRSKMAGLDYYHAPAFEFADRLEEVATILAVENVKANIAEVDQQRQHIQQAVAEIINQAGLDVKEPDGTLGRGLEVVDIGSTGRYTNVRGAGDFDLMVRVDRPDFMRENIRQGLVDALRSGLNHQNLMDNDLVNGNLRLKGCSVPGLEALVDIDITFVQKTDKLNFSPDQALSQRLENIKQADETKYYQVLANVEAAKQLLRSAEVYKSARSPDGQGGLGGVGVESWILQNGGSLLEAANSFLQEARGKSFAGFQAAYKIWDFGEDYMLIQNNSYKHSEFVSKNMSEAGYNKMVAALEAFVASVG